ncbi:MAG: glycosyltransferase family 4 protein [Methylocella sp.]|nr:MAG: glycosyltransferase family 1 protein [Hyphomicrobiales bacterium]
MADAMMMTINGRFVSQRATGVQRYAREIVTELDRLLQEKRFKSSVSAKLAMPAGSELDAPLRAIRCEQIAGGGPLWDQTVLPFSTEGVLLSLCNIGPLSVAKQIICIHDLNVFITPESYSRAFRSYYRLMLPLLAKRAARIVTVSQFSAHMLTGFGLCKAEKLTVIPNGHEHVRRWRPSLSRYASMEAGQRPFIFMLGIALHKNVGTLLAIAEQLDTLGLDILVAGASGKSFSTLDAGPVPHNVRILGFITDDDIAALYQNALCFAFPSLTEGFGLPALEALALGCPVIASNAASLLEVCGDAALYADPASPRDWLCQIKRLQDGLDLAQMLRVKGFRQAKRFSWAKSAELYLDLVTSLYERAD